MVAVIALTLSLLDPVLNMWCVIFKQYFMTFWDKGFMLETKHWWWLYISDKMKFPMDLHIKAYHLNHWLLSLYGFRYLLYSVIPLSQGWNSFPGVCSDLDIRYDLEFGESQTVSSSYESHPLTVPDSPVQSLPSRLELELAWATQFKLG